MGLLLLRRRRLALLLWQRWRVRLCEQAVHLPLDALPLALLLAAGAATSQLLLLNSRSATYASCGSLLRPQQHAVAWREAGAYDGCRGCRSILGAVQQQPMRRA